MVDHFAALGLPRCADLDPDRIRAAFQENGKQCHPDHGGDAAAFDALNQAHQTIADAGRRLRHLFELTFSEAPDAAGAVDTQTMALFECVAPALAVADDFLKRKAAATTAIARAVLAAEEARVSAEIFTASGTVRARKAEVIASFANLDEQLAKDPEEAREVLLDRSRALVFLAKWESQLSERMAGLI